MECAGLDEALKWAAGCRPQQPGRSRSGLSSGAGLSHQYGEMFRDRWWAAVAVVTRLIGDLGSAEDAVQEACAPP